jgi:triacylglycerol lipase
MIAFVRPTVWSRVAPALALAFLTACGSLTDPLSPDALRAARRPRATAHTPVLFVHGWNASAATWTTMVGRFKKDGWTAAELATFSYNTAQSNATTAAQIAFKVDSIRAATGSARVEIVTHSMGALSARYYLRNDLSAAGKVDALVTLAGANHGTNSAIFCANLTSCQEMVPSSPFLDALNAIDETPGAFRYAAWWSPCDEVINPLASARLDGAAETQTACLRHSDLHENATVYAQVRDWVNVPATPLVM